jgi:Kazal-type serine protease inhibitor-like protein
MKIAGMFFSLVALALAALLATSLLPAMRAHAVPAGQPCGTESGAACDKGLWCEPLAGKCGATTGVCVVVPRFCIARKKSRSFRPVCGCNNKTYSSDCFRRAYRVAKSHDGKC